MPFAGRIVEVHPLEIDLETLAGCMIGNGVAAPIPLLIVAIVVSPHAVGVVVVAAGEVVVVHVLKSLDDCWGACGAQFRTPPAIQQEMVKEIEMKRGLWL